MTTKITRFSFCIAILASQFAWATPMTVVIPKTGAPTHNAGSAIKSVTRQGANSCGVIVNFTRKPKFIMATLVGQPFTSTSGEAPALIVAVAQPTPDGKEVLFSCYTTKQIFYKDINNQTKSAISLDGGVNSGALLHIEASF